MPSILPDGPMEWFQWVAVALLLLAASWGLLGLLASRLPPGLLKDLTGSMAACLTTARRLRRDSRVPRRAKLAVAFAVLWVMCPLDLVPEFLPLIGLLDDVVVVVLALRYAARRVPRAVLDEAWVGDPAVLNRLLGRATHSVPA